MQQPLSINISCFDIWCVLRKGYCISCELSRKYLVKTKKSQMWISRKNNCKDILYQRHQECKGKKTEIGSIRCTRSNKIAHRKCQCLTESLRPLLPFSLLLCSGGVRYTSHLVPPLWLEKHTLSSPYSLATVDVQVSTFNLSSLTSYGWAEELIQTYPSVPALGVTLRVRQSPQRPQFGFMTSGTNQTRTLWLYLGALQSFANPVDKYLIGCCSYTHWS